MATWRQRADAAIRPIIAANPTADERTLRRLLRDAYPFGERRNYPYQVWLDQVNRYLDACFPKRGLPRQHPWQSLPLFRARLTTRKEVAP